MSTLFIDWSNMMYRALFVSNRDNPFDEERTSWKRLMMSMMNTTLEKHPGVDEVVVAGDGENTWRKSIWSGYKAKRSDAKEESPIDFDRFFAIADSFWDEISGVFRNFKWMKINGVEADDIVAVLSKKLDRDCICVSTDKDYVQLLANPKFHLWSPKENGWRESLNPKLELGMKIVCGDKSDNIPGIKRGLGPKRAEKMLTEGALDGLLETDAEANENYIRNKKLIDMSMIPGEVAAKIERAYVDASGGELEKNLVWNFVLKNSTGRTSDIPGIVNLWGGMSGGSNLNV